MREHDEDDLMKDPEIQRELEALLAVRPSPALAARVRAEIAREPVRVARWWRPSRTIVWGLAAACACVVLTLVNWWLVTPSLRPSQPGVAVSSSSPRPSARPPAETAAARPPSGGASEAIEPRAPVLRPRVTRAPLRVEARTRPREPEVLVAADEARALRALVANGREGRVQVAAIDTPSSGDLSGTAWIVRPLEPVVLTPIQFDPVPRVGAEEGER